MKLPTPENFAKDRSQHIAWCIFALILIAIGFMIENVDSTPYPLVAAFILTYSTFGLFWMNSKGIEPSPTTKISAGKTDLAWGFKHLYWTLWWPRY